jgi:DNA-binding PadR family transcriptional regulator
VQLLERDIIILKQFAKNGPAAGYQISKDLEFNTRKTYAALKKLETEGYIELIRVEKNRPGLNKKIYDLTLNGLLVVLSKLHDHERDQMEKIALYHRTKLTDAREIFEEWDYISRNKATKNHIIDALISWAKFSLHFIHIRPDSEGFKQFWDKKQTLHSPFGLSQDGRISPFFLPSEYSLLGYAFMLNELVGDQPGFTYKDNPEMNEVLEYCLKNPNLKKVIEREINSREEDVGFLLEKKKLTLSYIRDWKNRHGLTD